MAIDHATNIILQDLGFSLPAYGLCDQHYRGRTAEDIYADLDTKRKSGGNDFGVPLDVHIYSSDPYGSWARDDEFPTSAERRRLREVWVKELAAALPGRQAGEFSEEIARAANAEIDWRTLLHQFMSGLRRDDYRLYPPNRKHIWRDIMLPSLGAPGPSHIVIAIDTSGSMSADMLSTILAEIDTMRSVTETQLTLVECDAAIQNAVTYEPWELADIDLSRHTFKGRGGTDFRPVFEWIEGTAERGLAQPDALVYMTDGIGRFPARPSSFPTLWVLFSDRHENPPFGTVIKMPS